MDKDKKGSGCKYDSSKDNDCDSYYSEKENAYVYRIWDSEGKSYSEIKLKVGVDISAELCQILIQMDQEIKSNNRCAYEQRSAIFERKLYTYSKSKSEDDQDPWDILGSKCTSPETVLFHKEKPESELEKELHRIISEEYTEEQQELYYMRFGECMSYEEFSKAEEEKTGKHITKQAIYSREKKIFKKTAKALDVKTVNKSKPKKSK